MLLLAEELVPYSAPHGSNEQAFAIIKVLDKL
jgi:hypothetical protein